MTLIIGRLIDIIINGIAFGFLLALLASGLVLIFGLGGILNLAHGEFALIAGYTAFLLMEKGMNPIISLVIGIFLVSIIGLAIDRSIFIPIYRLTGEARILSGILVTLGISLFIHSYLATTVPFHFSLGSYIVLGNVSIGNMVIRTSVVISSIISLAILLALSLFLKYTRIGMATRAILQDEFGSCLCGINISNLQRMIFVMGVTFSGIAGILYAFIYSFEPAAGVFFTILSLIVAVISGVRSVYGAIISGILLGIVYWLMSYFIGAYVPVIVFLSLSIVMILLRAR